MATRVSINKKIKKLQRKQIQCEHKAEKMREKAHYFTQHADQFKEDAEEYGEEITALKRKGLGETKG